MWEDRLLLRLIEKNLTDTNPKVDEFLEHLLDRHNLNVAYLQVVGNRRVGCIEGRCRILKDYRREYKEQLL